MKLPVNTHFFLVLPKKIWPFLFWGWLVWVSLWIESAHFAEPATSSMVQSYSGFSFSKMNFEQRSLDGAFIHVTGHKADFDDNAKTLHITSPQFTYLNEKKTEVKPSKASITAKGDKGIIQTMQVGQQTTALPSELLELVISGNVTAQGEDWSATTSQLTFNNKEKKVYFSKDCKIKKGQMALNSSEEMFYNLTTSQLERIKKIN